jgi:phosphatidylglycerophosphate synthase
MPITISHSFLICLYIAFYMDGWRGTAASTTIFIAASVTDWLDGYIARKVLAYSFQTPTLTNPTFPITMFDI